jgi:hypothetical protein
MRLARPRVLPGAPITARMNAFNGRFSIEKIQVRALNICHCCGQFVHGGAKEPVSARGNAGTACSFCLSKNLFTI